MTDRKCILKDGERLDDLNRNNLKIIQNPDIFCFGMDAVLLSGFAKIAEGDICMDFGTGNGIIPLLLSAKTRGRHFTGLEILDYSFDMALRSVEYNGLSDRISIVKGDIREASSLFPLSSFDVVTCNPPYMNDLHGLKNPDEAKAIARHEVLVTLDDVCRSAASLLRPGGTFFMVHRPFRLVEIFEALRKYKLEPKRMQLVYPFADKEPNMVLLAASRGGKPMIKCEKPLIIYKSQGVYTDEIYEIYGY